MTPNEYQEKAGRTSPSEYPLMKLAQADLIHAHLGMSSETGEIGDCLKKHLVYGQRLDVDNLNEECGDLLWYISLMLTAIGVSLEECMQENVSKLKIRYPERFTEECAKERLDKV